MARILVVDDEPSIRTALNAVLRRPGHVVSAAADGLAGVLLFKQGQFDLVLTDVRMPGLTGPELIREVRGLRPEIPVIIMGGGGSIPPMDPATFARSVGADAVLLKPFSAQQVFAAIEPLLAGRPPQP